MAGQGLQFLALSRIPATWSPEWFSDFIREVLKFADTRNAVEGPGITITGQPDQPATISTSDDIFNLLQQPYILATPSAFLPNERILEGETGVISITDEGPGGDIIVGVEYNGIGPTKFRASVGNSVVGNPVDITGNVQDIVASNENDVLRLLNGLVQFVNQNGSASLPTWSYTNDPDSGDYLVGTNNVGTATDGVLRWDVDTARVAQSLPLIVTNNSGIRVDNVLEADAGVEIITFGSVVADGLGSQLAFWERGNHLFGHRLRMEGDVALTGDFVWYRHDNSSGGAEVFRIKRTTSQILFQDGTAGIPPVSWASDPDSGMYRFGSNVLGWSTGATARMTLDGSGNLELLTGSFYGRSGNLPTTPSYSFSGSPGTGMWSLNSGFLAWSINGTELSNLSTAGFSSTVPFRTDNGSAGAPSFTTYNDTNTGSYFVSADEYGIATGGVLRVQIGNSTANLPADNYELRIGAGNDLRLYHNGTDSLVDNDTGNLVFTTPGVFTFNGTALGVGANPTASVGLTAVNGSATTFLRSDGAPALDQGIAPTWTAPHIFSGGSGGGTGADLRIVRGTSASLNIYLSTESADGRSWSSTAFGNQMFYRAQKDDNSDGRDYLVVSRAANAITGIEYGNSTDNPTHTFNGPLALLGQSVGTGANVPTIGTNKPGSAVSLTPVTWLTIPVNGTTYYIPLWE